MTRVLLWLLETWTGERYVRLSSVLDVAPAGSECGRLVGAWVAKYGARR